MPLFQNESNGETFHMKMSSACSFIFIQIKVIFIRMVSHLEWLWNRGTRKLGNGLFRSAHGRCCRDRIVHPNRQRTLLAVTTWCMHSRNGPGSHTQIYTTVQCYKFIHSYPNTKMKAPCSQTYWRCSQTHWVCVWLGSALWNEMIVTILVPRAHDREWIVTIHGCFGV